MDNADWTANLFNVLQVSQKRYFANDTRSSFLDALPLTEMDNTVS